MAFLHYSNREMTILTKDNNNMLIEIILNCKKLLQNRILHFSDALAMFFSVVLRVYAYDLLYIFYSKTIPN